MAAELDPRLIGLLRAALDLTDALRDTGVAGDIAVRLDAAGAELLQQLIGRRPEARAKLAGLTFEWPKPVLLQELAANDNGEPEPRGEETPALR